MTLSIEFLATLVCIVGIIGPGMFYMGRLSTRVEKVEDQLLRDRETQRDIFRKLDSLADAIREAANAGGVIHCPLAEDDRCAFRNGKEKEKP